MTGVNLRVIPPAVFLPLLYWTGAVVSITLMGYPSVVYMTPLAWLLAIPVGLRVAHETQSTDRTLLQEAFLAGGLLGFVQGLLLGIITFLAPTMFSDAPHPFLISAAGAGLGAPITGGLASLMAGIAGRKNKQIS